MKHLLFLLPAIASALLSSCATRAPVATPFVPERLPAKAEDISPAVSAARQTTALADAQGDVARAHVSTIGQEAKNLRESLEAITAEAARLKAQKTANERELDGLWQSLQALTTRNLFLESETVKASEALGRERALRIKVTDEMVRIQDLTARKETEATNLRLQLIDSEANREAVHATNTALSKAVAQHQSRADKLAGEIRLYRIALGIAVLLLVLWIALKFFLTPRLL